MCPKVLIFAYSLLGRISFLEGLNDNIYDFFYGVSALPWGMEACVVIIGDLVLYVLFGIAVLSFVCVTKIPVGMGVGIHSVGRFTGVHFASIFLLETNNWIY